MPARLMPPHSPAQWFTAVILVLGLGYVSISSLQAKDSAEAAKEQAQKNFLALKHETLDRQYQQCKVSAENRQAFIDLINLAVPETNTSAAVIQFRQQLQEKGLLMPVDCSEEQQKANDGK